MYVNTENFSCLPLALTVSPNPGQGRRRQIGPFQLDLKMLDRFNRLVVGLGRSHPLECDQIVAAADSLETNPAHEATPDCIAQRFRQAEPVSRLLSDSGWTPLHEVAPVLEAVQAYVLDTDDLIPDGLPRFGRLDDAIVIETAWPRISDEVLSYLDFCRLREFEAQLRGIASNEFVFTRDDWEVSRRAEGELRRHQRRVRNSSFVPRPVTYFRVH